MKDFEWLRGGSGSGLGGIRRTEVRNRHVERRVIEHPDGRIEHIESIDEVDVRDRYVSGDNAERLKAFFDLESHAAQHELPVHRLESMKADILRELQGPQTMQPRAGIKLIK